MHSREGTFSILNSLTCFILQGCPVDYGAQYATLFVADINCAGVPGSVGTNEYRVGGVHPSRRKRGWPILVQIPEL
jgi:hypothetical protein